MMMMMMMVMLLLMMMMMMVMMTIRYGRTLSHHYSTIENTLERKINELVCILRGH